MKKLIEIFDSHYKVLHERSVELIDNFPQEKLFLKPEEFKETYTIFSFGEFILRSAGAVEQTFGGITVKLWDDPFEWTLPEELSTNEKIIGYLMEVEQTRKKGFAYFNSDDDLYKEIPAPEIFKTIAQLLIETIVRAEHFQGRAFATFQMFSDKKSDR
jgi:hypothetical protein